MNVLICIWFFISDYIMCICACFASNFPIFLYLTWLSSCVYVCVLMCHSEHVGVPGQDIGSWFLPSTLVEAECLLFFLLYC